MRSAEQIRSFKQALSAETEGTLDVYKPEIERVLEYLGATADTSLDGEVAVISGLIRADEIGERLPFIAINAGIHAAVRWNRQQRFKPHDWMDFMHAAAGLPYCDYFLAENSLAKLVCSAQLKFDRRYETRVISDPAEAADLLEHLI